MQIFRVKDGINFKPGDPNYDLYKYSMKVTAKRLFPNYAFLDAPFNMLTFDPNDIRTWCAYMGCVAGNSTIRYRMTDDKCNIKSESFENIYNELSKTFIIYSQGVSLYLNTDNKVEVFDTYSHRFVNCRKIIKNPMTNNTWYKLYYKIDNHICDTIFTADHPLPVVGKGRTYVKNIKIGDQLYLAHEFITKNTNTTKVINIDIIEPTINDVCYDVETDSDHFDVSGINSHNCRTRVLANVNGPAWSHQRGNLSFTSINLPRLGIMHMRDRDPNFTEFFKDLDHMLALVEKELMQRYEYQAKKKVKNFPFLHGEGVWLDSDKLDAEDEIGEVLKHGSLSIGFIGLAECLVALTGKHHGESEESQELGLKIIGHMRDWCDAATERHHMNFTLLATPQWGTCDYKTA